MDEATKALAEEALHTRARLHPSWATQAGLPGHDARLRASGMKAYTEELALVQDLLARTRDLPESLDREILIAVLSLEEYALARLRTFARNPDLAVDFFDHLLSAMLAAHLSHSERLESIAGRLEGAPLYFREGWARFDPADVPPLWVHGAMLTAGGAPAFLDAVLGVCAEPGTDAALRDRVVAALALTKATLDHHVAWLHDLHREARGAIPIGRDAFERLLGLRGIAESPEALLEKGDRLVVRFRAEVHENALTVIASAGQEPRESTVAQALEIVRADHPSTFHEVLRFHDETISAAKAFVDSRGLATVTSTPLRVVETPAFLRHLIPFAAYMQPARFATPRQGVYLVTPKLDLAAFPRADVRNTVVHEAYPGHHLQLSVAAERASLAAFLSDAPDLAEGWALYCEAMMGRHGFTASPAERFVRSRDALWRAVRIVLDVSLAIGLMTPDEATARLMRETGMVLEEAEAEVLRYTQEPGYNLSYMWGRLEIEALRERALAGGMTERAFHDALLAAGSVPVALLGRAIETAAVDIRQS
jgi:hypothetical protein